jgi:2,4-dienoyl-CoA reductase-like NADH-dependent reductase (Old Yellow Enzyme family)
MPSLFDPVKIGDFELKNRIVMSPLTRCRADDGRVANAMMAEYYAQRAGAGLIITEATSISPMGVGYPDTPGIWSEAQIAGWKLITQAVHQAGGKIICQLWHVGRISHPVYLNGALPIAPSAIAPNGHVSILRPVTNYVVPRALEIDEIPGVIESYRTAAANAMQAGFDGVELHGANGYLLDQFLQDTTNKRSDVYGGSLENRAKFMIEAVDAAISVWGPGRVGLHLSPRSDSHDMGDSNKLKTFSYIAQKMKERNIAFICARESQGPDSIGPELKKVFGGAYIINEALTKQKAQEALDAGTADAAAFGKLYIANPDLVERFASDAPLNTPRPESFYAKGPEGYTNYPFLDSKAA